MTPERCKLYVKYQLNTEIIISLNSQNYYEAGGGGVGGHVSSNKQYRAINFELNQKFSFEL